MAETESLKLSILICTLPKRADFLKRLMNILRPQISGCEDIIEVLTDGDEIGTIGAKRNRLLQKAKGLYVAFIDDDDRVSNDYIVKIMEGIYKNVDCCSLIGTITDDGVNPRTFVHSLSVTSWFEEGGIYYRPPNHLNCVRTSIARQFDFPEISHGEDKEWSMAISRSGMLKDEHKIFTNLYFYEFRSKK